MHTCIVDKVHLLKTKYNYKGNGKKHERLFMKTPFSYNRK